MPGDWGDERGERVTNGSRQPRQVTDEQRAQWRALGREKRGTRTMTSSLPPTGRPSRPTWGVTTSTPIG